MRKFEFKKAYEEVEIAGDVYRIDISDKKLREYQVEFHDFYKESKRIEEMDTDNMSVEDQGKLMDEALEVIKIVVEKLLGEGSFETLYKKSGKSIANMADLIIYLSDVVEEKLKGSRKDKRSQYVNKSKNRKKRKK